MASTVDLDGVQTWYDERGRGDPLVLLHGGFSDSRAFGAQVAAFAEHFRCFRPDRRGHGRTPDVAGPITFGLMADDMARFVEQVVDEPADLVGHSDGAVVALLVALRRPDLVKRLVLVSGTFHRDGAMPGMAEVSNVDGMVEMLGPTYGEVSPDGADHFPVVVQKIADMMAAEPTLGADELAQVRARTLVMVSDDDLMTFEHVVATYDAIPDCELAVVPGTSHGLLEERADLCNQIVLDFLRLEPEQRTFAVRRAAEATTSSS